MLNKLLGRLRRSNIETPPAGGGTDAFPYRAVSVVPNCASCPAAVGIRHTRFLVAEAPTLPLPMCTWPLSCTCRYQMHNDRRGRERRMEEEGKPPNGRKDWRRPYGRRSTDPQGQ